MLLICLIARYIFLGKETFYSVTVYFLNSGEDCYYIFNNSTVIPDAL